MEYIVIIQSINQFSEVEWEEEIKASSKRGVRHKATVWLKKNLFESDYLAIDKERNNLRREHWILR